MAYNPRNSATKWKRNLQNSTQTIREGVEALTENPLDKAADAQEKMKRNLIASIDNGKWAAGLRAFGFQNWKNRMLTIGIDRIASGADKGEAGMLAFLQDVQGHIESGLAELDNMPDQTPQDAEARVLFWMRHMRDYQRN